ncbi:MAG: DUF3883 domain-containing protein [Verrucomicrobia bacterium]|nr:DUF3883 domain-containing protein [Verrucomicrobiota bacterium]
MILDPRQIPQKNKAFLTGLFLAKFSRAGFRRLGFTSFVEAYNAFGFALGLRPTSIKGYRDEFDPLLPNQRIGWNNRQPHPYRRSIYEEYKDLDLETFAGLVSSFVGYDENAWSEVQPEKKKQDGGSLFAKRLITGLAAESYFEATMPRLDEFKGCALLNTTRLGCGYDFRLDPQPSGDFLAVEVKGLAEESGSISLTPKEHDTAEALADRFFLFVVKSFRKKPRHEIHRNPLAGTLKFRRKETRTVQISWHSSV